MASEQENRLKAWKDTSENYCAALLEMAEALRSNANAIPSDHSHLLTLGETNENVLRAAQTFRQIVKRQRALVPSA